MAKPQKWKHGKAAAATAAAGEKKGAGHPDFKRRKVKPGRVLKKTTATETTVRAKQLVVLRQLETKPENAVLSHRGLALGDLCRQLGHYSIRVRQQAMLGLRQLLADNPSLASAHLRELVPQVMRFVSDRDLDAVTESHLRGLLKLVIGGQAVPGDQLSAHFPLILAHVLRGLSHINRQIKAFAWTVLVMLLQEHAELCERRAADLLDAVCLFLLTARLPVKDAAAMTGVLAFLKVFAAKDENERVLLSVSGVAASFKEQTCDAFLLRNGNGKFLATPFDVPAIWETDSSGSPFERPENVLRLSESLIPLLLRQLENGDSQAASDAQECVRLFRRLAKNESAQMHLLTRDAAQRIDKVWRPVNKLLADDEEEEEGTMATKGKKKKRGGGRLQLEPESRPLSVFEQVGRKKMRKAER